MLKRIFPASAAAGPPPSPFNGNPDRYEATIPLLPTFRFVHEPIGTASTPRFIGRQSEMESLAERILFSEGGSFLVTGYRGVGKTSFINQVIRQLKEALPWAEPVIGRAEIVDIYLNVARPVQPSEIMHHIIRRLHDRLVEKDIFNLLDPELREALTLAYYRTSVNMARKLAETTERTFGFNEASIGGAWMKAALKMSWNSKRSRTQNYEIAFLGYDDKSAEHDIITLSRRLAAGYPLPLSRWDSLKLALRRGRRERVRLKVVFVFDELDKLDELTAKGDGEQKPVVDQILGALKNLFTTSGVTFVFVAGKDLQERWLEDVGKGDSVYESVFSYDKYLPCLWADVDSICDGLVDMSRLPSPAGRRLYAEFKQYLAYKGRGIPRRIIRTFNQYAEWNGDRPVLAFTRQNLRNIRFYSGLQELLAANEERLFGVAHEEAQGTQSDKRRLGVYYLIDWVLRQGSSEFTLKDMLEASRRLSAKIALAEEIAAHVAERILAVLLSGEYIQEARRSPDSVIIGDVNALDEEAAPAVKRYRIAPRRLGEIGGLAAEAEEDSRLDRTSPTTIRGGDKEPEEVGKYKVLRKLGEGGMGAVYEATDTHTGRRVALKTLAADSMPELLARFEREARIMNELNHPNVVRLYDWGREDGHAYIAMEYLDGITLEEIIERRRRLGLDVAVGIVKTVAEVVQYVHEKGFVRNDIKPSNIMLTNTGRVCILDFGITKPARGEHAESSMFSTAATRIIGTPIFMPPEQFRGQVDERADIYALGVVLYLMLTGVLPFEGVSPGDVMSAQMSHEPAPPSQHVNVPPAVDEVVLKCLHKNPGERFGSMNEFAEALAGAAGVGAMVELKTLVSAVRAEVKSVGMFDNMRTLSTGELAALGGELAGLSDALPRTSKLLSSLKGEEDAPPETRPRLSLKAGSPAHADFNLKQSGRGYLLERRIGIGRSSRNAVVLRDWKVSRYHARLTVEGESWFVEDLNSGRGTLVNGERIDHAVPLKDGDEIQVGPFVFVFNRGGPD